MAAKQAPDRPSDQPDTALSAETERSILRLFEAVYSGGDLGVAEEVLGADARGYCAGTEKTYHGVSGLKAHAARLRATFAGLTVDLDEVHRTPDGFVASVTARGRFERAFGGIHPSCRMGAAGEEPRGPSVTMAGSVEGTTTDGRLSELEFDWNLAALRTQR